MIALGIFFYVLCGLITFVCFTSAIETDEIYNAKRHWRILLRFSYLLFWPIYYVVLVAQMIYMGIKLFINKLFE